MALSYDNLSALIAAKYLPVLIDNIFKKTYLFAILDKKAREYKGRKIVAPLEYAVNSNVQFTSKWGSYAITPQELFTAAEYTAKMLTGALPIALEDELESETPEAIKPFIDSCVKNLEKSVMDVLTTNLFSRTLQASQTNAWLHLADIINASTSVTVGGVISSSVVPTWWRSKVMDGDSFSGDITQEDDLIDPTKDSYIKRIIQKGIAKAKYLTGEEPDHIIVPQYIYDMIESIEDLKRSFKPSDRASKMGFTALQYRNSDIIPDEKLTAAQTGNTDGRIYFLNTDYLYLYFNPNARFKMGKFIEATAFNGKVAKVHVYGNMVTTNRAAQCVLTGIYSPTDYST